MSNFRVLSALLVAALLLAAVAIGSIVGETTRISVASSGQQGSGDSWRATVSDDGRYVAFSSGAQNFGPWRSGYSQVFLHDRTEGTTTQVSVNSNGVLADWSSGNSPPSISAEGRYVAFDSDAPNLVGLPVPEHRQVFVNDLVGLETSCVSVSSTGERGNGNSEHAVICTSGRYVAFETEATNFVWGDNSTNLDVYVRDRTAHTTALVSALASNAEMSGGNTSHHPAISDDGRYVAFEADSGAFVSGDSNSCDDIFVRDLTAKSTSRVSLASDGSQGNSFSYDPSISADGRFVAFCSYASNLV
ncbi:MAG: calcium-binding protein, partial [Armatimonadota bacterium]